MTSEAKTDNKTEKKILVVTSWSEEGRKLYGEAFLDSARRFWPPNMELLIVTDEMLAGDPDFVAFMERHAARRMDSGAVGYDYRQDLVRFSHKIFALKAAVQHPGIADYDWMVWLDGDVTTKSPVTLELLNGILLDDHDGVLLSRSKTAPHPECGFMAFNLKGKGLDFLEKYIGLWTSDDVLKFPELHDSHVFMAAVMTHMQNYGSKWIDLAPAGTGEHGLDAFEASPLHSFFVHRKGNRKFTEKPPMNNAEIVASLLNGRTGVVCKIGKPVEQILPDAVYVCDFTGAKALDIKKFLDDLPGDREQIYVGYYSSDEVGRHVDDTRFGINSVRSDVIVFDSIEREPGGSGYIHVAVPRSFKGGEKGIPTFTHRSLIPISQKEVADITNNAYKTNFLVQTQNCAPVEEIQSNIKANLNLITNWIQYVKPHFKRAIVVSGGPSLRHPETLKAIRREVKAGAYLFCVKHAHRFLVENGIIPWACVLLDPRPHDGLSTHGESREELLPGAIPGVRYYIASMVHPSVTEKILRTGGRVIGWHAAVGAKEQEVLPPEHARMLMGGGSSSASRAMVLAWQFLGFNSIGLYAFDSCHLDHTKLDKNARHQDGTPKYIELELTVGGKTKKFWTDRDILSQAHDFTRLIKECPWLKWDAHGPGMVAWLYENSTGRLPTFEEATR